MSGCRYRSLVCATAGFALAAVLGFSAVAKDANDALGGPLVMRRLTPAQYRQTIADIFGRSINLGGRFEPDQRADGLFAVGTGRVSVAAAGLEQYDAIARTVAAEIVSEPRRDTLIPCKPQAATGPDDACARQFFARAGRLLYRRPLTEDEAKTWVNVANGIATSSKDFYGGLAAGLSDMLVSLPFLFRQEAAVADHDGALRTDAYTTAARLSFFLWNAPPDSVLLQAAETGALNTKAGLAAQVDRMLTSPRVEAGVRAFFTDMFRFSDFDGLTKDHAIYPKFTGQSARDAQEQTLRTVIALLMQDHGDYRDIFTTRKTFLTPTLGALYGVPVALTAGDGETEPWSAHEYPAGDPHVGILTQASFVALHSHPARSSPTLRGRALREIMLCQKVPDPPGNVNFDIAQDTNNPDYKTARERLTAHRTDAACAGCHKVVDPIGLALETFDSAAGLRTTENGAAIDTSGELDGFTFADAIGLGKAVHDDPATPSCFVKRLYTYAVGRPAEKGETVWLKSLETGFAKDGYRLPELMRRIATSDAMYSVSEIPRQTAAVASPTEVDRKEAR